MPLPLAAVIGINAGSAVLGGLLRNLTTPEIKPPPDQTSQIMRSGTVMHAQAAQNMRPVIEQLMLQSSGSNNVAALQTAFRHAGGAADRIDAMIADQLTRASVMRSEQMARANEFNAIQRAQGWQNTIAGLGAATESVLTALDDPAGASAIGRVAEGYTLGTGASLTPTLGPDGLTTQAAAEYETLTPMPDWSKVRFKGPNINRPAPQWGFEYAGKGQPFPW